MRRAAGRVCADREAVHSSSDCTVAPACSAQAAHLHEAAEIEREARVEVRTEGRTERESEREPAGDAQHASTPAPGRGAVPGWACRRVHAAMIARVGAGSRPATPARSRGWAAAGSQSPRDTSEVYSTASRGRWFRREACCVTENAPEIVAWEAITVASVASVPQVGVQRLVQRLGTGHREEDRAQRDEGRSRMNEREAERMPRIELWRRDGDSNPGRAINPYTLSRRATSTAHPSLRNPRVERRPDCAETGRPRALRANGKKNRALGPGRLMRRRRAS